MFSHIKLWDEALALFDFLKRDRSEDRFAERVMARLRATGWSHEIAYDPQSFSIRTKPEGDVLHLEIVYREWLTYPRAAQAAQLDRIIAPVLEADLAESFDEAEPRLLPLVRSMTDLQVMALDSEPPDLELWQPCRRLAGPLGVLLAINLPNSTALVPHSKLEAWGKTFDELFERALDNLIAISPVRFEQTDAGFLISNYEDGYDASRLLMPELFVALQLKGAPVAVAVTRDHVVVAGSEDVPALKAMAAHVTQIFNDATRPMSYQPLILNGECWEPFEGGLSADLRDLRDLSCRQAVWDDSMQTPRLERFLAHHSQDVFVAPLDVVLPDADAFTWTSWTEGVPALLPKAHGVGMAAADGRKIFRLWSDIEAVCGPFTEDTAFHPSRYRPPAWPSPDAFLRLEREFPTPGWWEAATA